MSDSPDQTMQAAHDVADRLQQRGHVEPAAQLRAELGRGHVGAVLLEALRESLQVVLTAVEAIDPVSGTMVEELRVMVDARLLAIAGSETQVPPAG